jgi:hypothetical protein
LIGIDQNATLNVKVHFEVYKHFKTIRVMVKCYITIQTFCKRYRIRKDDVQHIHFIKKRALPLPPAYPSATKIEEGFTSCEEEEFKQEAIELPKNKHYNFQ